MEVGKKKMYYGVGSACGTKPNLGSALAPNILLKKRLDFEAPAATTIGEPVSGFKRTDRKTSSPIHPSDFRWSAEWMVHDASIALRPERALFQVINSWGSLGHPCLYGLNRVYPRLSRIIRHQ